MEKKRCLFLCLLVFSFTVSCNGPQPLPNAQRTVPGSYEQIDDYVVEVFEDDKGNLWFGTMARGAARYDGKVLSCLSVKDGLIDNTVVSVAQDSSGNMWFGTHNGASRYSGNKFTNFGAAQGLRGSGCKIFVDSKGTIWAGTHDGAFRFNGTGFSPFILPDPGLNDPMPKWGTGKVWDIMEDRKGNIWFARHALGVCKFDGKTFIHFTTRDSLCSNNVSNIIEDKKGAIWFACISSDLPKPAKGGGVTRYDPAAQTFTSYNHLEGLSENDVYTLYEDRAGNIWIGATHYGAYRYDGKNFAVFKETDRPDLTVNFGLQDIWEDRNGTLWCGFSGGLFRFNGSSFINVTQNGPWK